MDGFLKMAHLYSTPENLLRTELITAFQETSGATAALMSTEDYFQGGETEFNNAFQRQIEKGIYIVRRVEEVVRIEEPNLGRANAALGTNQQDYGDQVKTAFYVKKILDDTGQPQRNEQRFKKFGISVTLARVTDVDPNTEFKNACACANRQRQIAPLHANRVERVGNWPTGTQ